MFYYLNGTVAEIDVGLAVIDCGGIGYEVNTTTTTLSQIRLGEKAKLYTHLNVREDAVELFGFSTQQEKHFFQLLIGVSGVGPKAALSILSSAAPEALAMAIINGNEKALTVAPGIGKKIAQRVILELKDKIAKETDTLGWEPADIAPIQGTARTTVDEAAAALSVLGYSASEIRSAMNTIQVQDQDTETLVKLCLRALLRG